MTDDILRTEDEIEEVPEEPKVQLFNRENDQEILEDNQDTTIEYGEVKAGDKSEIVKLRFWNNKGGDKVCSTMRDTELFVLDSNKGKTNPLVKEGWLHAKCVTGDSSSKEYLRLRDSNSLPVTADGLEEGLIEGKANDGNPEGEQGKKNHADLDTYIQIIDNILTASHGDKPFYIALRYYFT